MFEVWNELTLKQKVALGFLRGFGSSLPYMTDKLNRTERSLLRRRLATSWHAFDLVCICLTVKGKAMVAKKPPMWWIQLLYEQNFLSGAYHFVEQLAIEELPQFLVSNSAIERVVAQQRFRELLGEGRGEKL